MNRPENTTDRNDVMLSSSSSEYRPAYTSLSAEFWEVPNDQLAALMPIFALAATNPEVRRLADELFKELYVRDVS